MKKEAYIKYMDRITPDDSCRDDIYKCIASSDVDHDGVRKEDRSKNEKNRKTFMNRRNPARIAVIAAVAVVCLILVSGGSVYAYQHFIARYIQNKSNYYNNHFAEITDAEGNVYQYDNSLAIDQTSAFKNLSITCRSAVYDEHTMYVNFGVETKDGSALVVNSEDIISDYRNQKFGKVYIYVDGTKIFSNNNFSTNGEDIEMDNYCNQMKRVDSGEMVNKAEFELKVTDDQVTFTDKNIEVLLSDYKDCQAVTSGIGFKFNSVGELAGSAAMAADSDFYELDGTVYNLGPYYGLNSSEQKIYFSEKYPTAYIDNCGFKKDERNGCDVFYLTIAPGNENTDELLNLRFQNTITGSTEESFGLNAQNMSDKRVGIIKLALPDGRIQMMLYRRDDAGRISATLESLSDYTIKCSENDNVERKPVIASGTVRFDFYSDEKQADAEVKYDLTAGEPSANVSSESGEHVYTISNVLIKTANIEINGTLDTMFTGEYEDNAFVNEFDENMNLILEDGTKLECKWDGATSKMGTCTFGVRWKVNAFISPAKVVAIEWNGERIELK